MSSQVSVISSMISLEENEKLRQKASAISSPKSSSTVNNTIIRTNGTMNAKLISNSSIQYTALQNVSVKDFCDPFGPYQIQDRILTVVKQWEKVIPQNPNIFLMRLLKSRGHNCTVIPAMTSKYYKAPTEKQLMDYDTELVLAVRNSDLVKLKQLHARGVCMNACNKFGESIVHMACRRATFEVIDFIMRHGGNSWLIDDFGRTPLHDACWRPEPRFDIVTLVLNYCPELLLIQDVRSSQALHYVREEHWRHWCAFFFHQRDKYWPIQKKSEEA